mgnify:FL=1
MSDPTKGILKVVGEVIIVGVAGALIAWGTTTNTLDSVKTTVTDNTKWRGEHSLAQAQFEGKIGANIETMKELLKEIRDEQKEIRKELNRKQDKK